MAKTIKVALAAAVLLSASAAYADHGKAGAWHLDTRSKLYDPHGALMRMPVEAVGYLKDAYNKHSKADYCMRAEDVSANVLATFLPNCTMGPTTVNGQTMQANFTCQGALAGSGQMTVTYDKPEHYTGESTFELAQNSYGLQSKSTYEGTWTGDTCPAP